MDTEMKDIVGQPIKLGDRVATDTMAYRSSSLRIGTITEVNERTIKVTYMLGDRRQSVWRYPQGVVKVAA